METTSSSVFKIVFDGVNIFLIYFGKFREFISFLVCAFLSSMFELLFKFKSYLDNREIEMLEKD